MLKTTQSENEVTGASQSSSQTRSRTASILAGTAILALAVLMGLPAIRGEFVGGDDHNLVLHHVLVNQPSFKHAIELFAIVHRDLYQPIPLLTFQFEFLVADWFNLFAESVEQGAWLFHFDNMWLHGINALLVAAVLLMLMGSSGSKPRSLVRADSAASRNTASVDGLAGSRQMAFGMPRFDSAAPIAWTAALIFAVHPLQVEVVAWINGRMMLLSTMFALCAMLALARWLDRKSFLTGALVILCVLLSVTSKVRGGLPILLALVPLAKGMRLGRRFWMMWSVCTGIVVLFVGLNLWSTAEADFFAGGARHLHGPALARVFMALAFYFEHFLWPVGLASYYPAPVRVSWSDPATVAAIGTVLIALAIMAFFSWKSRACFLGSLWFFAGIVDTLPFFPARNILAADRYMYLPIIGLAWFAAILVCWCHRRWSMHRSATEPNAAAAIVALVLIPLLIGICWRVAGSYTTARTQAERIAKVFPGEPRVWERLGWTYHRAGEYDRAIDLARLELRHDAREVQSGAFQLIGLSQVKKGDVATGLAHLEKAIELHAEEGLAYFRLATALEDVGRHAEAVPWYEKALGDNPRDNPTLRRLAMGYRRQNRITEAHGAYMQALQNNPYEVEAVIGLVELAIDSGTPDSFEEAEGHLVRLLQDIPNEPRLRANLGMIRFLANEADDHLLTAARAFIALTDGRHSLCVERIEVLDEASESASVARKWLLAQLERFDQERPDSAWTYGISARVLIADGQTEAARVAVQLFEQLCADEDCRFYGRELRQELAAEPAEDAE